MCGRYIPNTENEIMEIREILRQISLRLLMMPNEEEEEIKKREVYPSHITPLISCLNEEITYERAKWGFEKWDHKGLIINAKSETVDQSRFFNPYVQKYRCIIPAHGYYEWKTQADKSKIKYEFIGKETGGIFMAGLFRPTESGKEFVILTKAADENIQFIHNRMPLMLSAQQMKPWLLGELDPSILALGDYPHLDVGIAG